MVDKVLEVTKSKEFARVSKEIFPPVVYRFLLKIRQKIRNDTQPSGEQLIKEKSTSICAIYMHIHKCGGTSLMDAIKKHPQIIACAARPGNFPIRTGRNRIPFNMWNKSFKFTFVRNPYIRLVSAYLMFTKMKIWKPIFPTFRDFVEFLEWSNIHEHSVEQETPIKLFGTTIGNIIHHCSSYHNPKYCISEMDFIGRIENFDEDLKVISKKLQIPLIVNKKLNRSKKNYDYRLFYTEDLTRRVYRLYQEDIDRFGYVF